MSDYIVSARKYRPQRFDDVVGQRHVTATLKNAIHQGQIAHAYLFCGPRGVGKTTCARILAKTINCENISADSEACGTCSSCETFQSQASFNIIELDAASHNSVEHIRTLNEQVRFQPQHGKYKVFIIDEVHMLSSSAFNAFLKTLEEPPPFAIFILATTEKHKIIPTILSRCQIYDFRRIQIPEIIGHLKDIAHREGINAEDDALHIIAEKSDGALRDSLTIFDRMASYGNKEIQYQDVIQNLSVLDYDYYFQFIDAFLTEDRSKVLNLFKEIQLMGFDSELFISGLSEHLRNLLVCTDPATRDLLQVSETQTERYENQASLCSESFLLTSLDLLNKCGIDFQRSQNKQLHTEICLLKITFLNRVISGEQIQEKKKESKQQEVKGKVNKTVSISKANVGEDRIEIISPPAKVSPTLTDLEKIEKEIIVGENEARSNAKPFNLKTIEEIWASYTNDVNSPSLRSVLKSASLKLSEKIIECTVSSEVSKEMIQQEIKLVDRIRKEVHDHQLLMQISVDSPVNGETKQNRILTNKEKYESLMDTNPLVKDLKDRFDLRVDHDY